MAHYIKVIASKPYDLSSVPCIPALGRWRQGDLKFKVNLECVMSLRAGESPQARQLRTVNLLRSLSSEDTAGQVKGNGKSNTRKDKVAQWFPELIVFIL